MISVLLWFLGLIYAGVCVWVILIVLVQEGKQGGMSAMGAASSAPGAMTDSLGAGGAQKALFSWTAWSAAIFLALALALTIVGNMRERAGGEIDLGAAPTQVDDRVINTTNEAPVEADGDMNSAIAPDVQPETE